MPRPLDSAAVRDWCALARDALGAGREEIDAINVFPVADGDTGTNLHRTLDAAARALDESGHGDKPHAPAGPALRILARGALLGACGNSGTILAQVLRGMSEAFEDEDSGDAGSGHADQGGRSGGARLAAALRRGAESGYEAVAHPVEGTMLTVARAAADAATHAGGDAPGGEVPGADESVVARAAHEGAREGLAATTGQLDILRRAGVVDAGGSGLVAVLGALADALDGTGGDCGAAARPVRTTANARPAPPREAEAPAHAGPAYEVMYLLDAGPAALAPLRERLDALGDSLVIGGGDDLWSVHVHVDDAGAAVEAGIEAGRPHRVRISHLSPHTATAACAPRGRAVVAVVAGEGLAGLCEEAGATVVRAPADGGAVDAEALLTAVRETGAAEVVLLPNDAELHQCAARAAELARTGGPPAPSHAGTTGAPPDASHAGTTDASHAGVRVTVIPTRAAVQGVAALAVHEPDHRFDEDVVAMSAAAGATRYGEVTVAERESWTMAGICQAGDVLGLVEGDVAVIGDDVTATAADVLERMLAAGGEMVTLVLGAQAPEGLAADLRERVRRGHLGVDTVVHDGGQDASPLLIGVE